MIQLSPDQLKQIRKILLLHLPKARVTVFGSRVVGVAKPFSDLDISVDLGREIDPISMANLKDAFAESNLPIKVDVVDWHSISSEFQKIIAEHGEVLELED